MNKPHKHAKIIKAWADGAEIEFKQGIDNWYLSDTPNWDALTHYRIKPEPAPDIVESRRVRLVTCTDRPSYMSGSSDGELNVRYVFDGETSKLKSVSML